MKNCDTCGNLGWVYPNLGITRPAGDCHGSFHPDLCNECGNPQNNPAALWFIFREIELEYLSGTLRNYGKKSEIDLTNQKTSV